MAKFFNRKIFQCFPISLFFLISFLLLPTPSLWAQCSPPVTNCSTDGECSDGNICNGTELCFASGGVDTFSAPTCHCGTTPPDNTVICTSDGVFCNGNELCVGGLCNAHSGDPCSGTECNTCNETDNNCFDPVNTPCTEDGNFCTTDACNGSGSCVSSNNDFLCEDKINCTVNDVCSGGVCAGTQVQCNDQISCSLDSCLEATGQCTFDMSQCECQTDADCNDNNGCTDEFCCTDKSCIADGTIFTCIRSNNSLPCDDSMFCNGDDTCAGGTCSLHSGDPCIGGGQCAQICDEPGDTCFAPTGLACDDGDLITITECDGKGACLVVANIATQGSTVFGCSLNFGGNAPMGIGALASLLSLPGLLFIFGRLRHCHQRRPN